MDDNDIYIIDKMVNCTVAEFLNNESLLFHDSNHSNPSNPNNFSIKENYFRTVTETPFQEKDDWYMIYPSVVSRNENEVSKSESNIKSSNHITKEDLKSVELGDNREIFRFRRSGNHWFSPDPSSSYPPFKIKIEYKQVNDDNFDLDMINEDDTNDINDDLPFI